MVSAAQAELANATRQYPAVKHHIIQEVHQAQTQYRAAQRALEILSTDILPSAIAAADNAEVAYSVGEISYLELLNFRREVIDSHLRFIEAEADMRRAKASLKHSIGFDSIDQNHTRTDVLVTSRERP